VLESNPPNLTKQNRSPSTLFTTLSGYTHQYFQIAQEELNKKKFFVIAQSILNFTTLATATSFIKLAKAS
jgi:hypothetical protein